MKPLSEMTLKSLKARRRREKADLKRRLKQGDPPYVVNVVTFALMATCEEIQRRENAPNS